MSARPGFLETVIDAEGLVATDRLAEQLHITKTELAIATGLSRDAVSKQARSASSLSDLGPRRVPPQPFRGHLLRNRDIILRK